MHVQKIENYFSFAGCKALFFLAFAKNDEQIRRYQPEIPYINLDVTPNLPAEYTRVSTFN